MSDADLPISKETSDDDAALEKSVIEEQLTKQPSEFSGYNKKNGPQKF